ncbi:exodeoxyribonuclease V subunit gamma [Gordonia crocea]|uniref:RecBCD enzyme subunit RecC n=1 Tax=Gordonia crocea TaxID=589162 RepID=A0A7I9UXV2_9ACTN|nr:exodeoxyribonuclease V subunit gamma [Gordonia crocea]GED98037.1 RecBCD enzyme subunit RecC [Gordonia crocea]
MLTVHRAERADTLAEVLAATMAVPLDDPMAAEVVAVAANGVQRWLAQRLAQTLGAGPAGDGIAANIEFVAAAQLLARVVDPYADDYGVAASPWEPEALVWSVLAGLDEMVGDPALAMLARHIDAGDDGWRGRRLATATTIARLFWSYGWQRPRMIAAWARGEDTDGAVVSGEAGVLDLSHTWQPKLWRQVRGHIGTPHVAEVLDDLVASVRADPTRMDLPERVSLFGPTRIPQMLRELMDALASHRDVALYLPHPSPALWREIAAKPVAPGPEPRALRVPPPIVNPALASLSRDVQELQESLGATIGRDDYHPGSAPATTLLGALQSALREDTADLVAGLSADSSLEFHSCHGRERQVEVVRERLLHLFDEDETLEPRDVLIMCPDIEEFAPLITGAFGRSGAERTDSDHPATALRVRLADRGLLATNDVLGVVARVIALGVGRVTVSDLLDLAAADPVRRRFGFTDDDLDNLGSWAQRANIRWGIDAQQRARYGLAGFPQGTAEAGLSRLLLSVAADEAAGRWLGTALPLGGIDSSDTAVVGRFAELTERLGSLLARFDAERPATAWADVLTDVVDQLTLCDRDSEWQRAQAVRLIRDSLSDGLSLGPSDVRDLVDDLVGAAPTRANFCTGELTVCSMVPMRSVPHRAIILLGMDAEAFPRTQSVDGDDILAVEPLVGERSRRDEDRQAFLDAITAAGEHLIVCYTGADPINGSAVPPSVVVSELLDMVGTIAGAEVASQVVRSHPLHAFDGQNFRAPQPFSFDRSLLAGARTLDRMTTGGRVGRRWPVIGEESYPPPPTGDVDLTDLIAFIVNPADGFLRQRLGVMVPRFDEAPSDQLSVDLDSLEKWAVGDRLLAALLAGAEPADARAAELRRGTLPPFELGQRVLAPIAAKAEALADRAAVERRGSARTIDIRVELPGGRRLYGTVGDVYDDGPVAVTYSGLRGKQRLAAWISLLALTAGSAEKVAGACVIGGYGKGTGIRRYTPVDDAADVLAALVALRDTGLAQPFSLDLAAAESAAESYDRSGNPAEAIDRARGRYTYDKYNHNESASLLLTGDPATALTFDRWARRIPDDLGIDTPWVAGSGLPGFLQASLLLFAPLRQQEVTR